MTTTELKKKIIEFENTEWYKDVTLKFEFSYINFSSDIKGLSAIYEFIIQQIEGWESLNIPNFEELTLSKGYFISVRDSIIKFVNSTANLTDNQLKSRWDQLVVAAKNQLRNTPLLYNCPETEFLISVNAKIPNSSLPAFLFITNQINTNSTANKDYYIGFQLAYEFSMKDFTEISLRRKAEQSSISKIRNDFYKYLEKSESEIIENLSNVKEQIEDRIREIDEFKLNKGIVFTEWFEASKNNYDTFDTESKKKIKDLEIVYNELLSLSKPAEYWRLRAVKLKKEGWKAIYWLLGLVGLTCFTLYFLLWWTPDGMLLSFTKGNASAIKWSIIYVTFIAFLTYGIRALNKIAFSSFHLARDSEEREQLTFVYLALIKDGSADDKDKNLIMQSLFSRADTGLLKDDSSPTMPNDISGKLFGK